MPRAAGTGFMWLKDNIYRNNPQKIEELKGGITAAVESIVEETLAAIMENFNRRQEMVLNAQCSHIEYIFFLHKKLPTIT
jgi:hypothetical protein